ncbi:hypothetical protein E4T42_06012 [Aureobasidium subglaciale]|nr:hypothetical protein E4T42_06012 [Aureobasidium subglaciale]
MAAALDAIGLISGGLGIIQFFLDNVPSSTPQGASVQIKAGLGDDTSDNLGGGIDNVYAFDYNNNYLGVSSGCSMGDGGVCQVTVDQGNAGVQADYVSISNGNDATCIAWVSVSQFDSSPGGAWTGDIGYNCGDIWYYGNQLAGRNPDGSEYRPYCAWFDGDHTNGFQYASLKFTVRAYGEKASDTISQNKVCSASIFGADTGPINGQPESISKKRSVKRAPSTRRSWMENRLIISSHAGHTAEHLCDSATSWGPDFVGADGQFCDMATKTLSPLCSKKDVDGCMDVSQDGTVVAKRSIARRSVPITKAYAVVSVWGDEA